MYCARVVALLACRGRRGDFPPPLGSGPMKCCSTSRSASWPMAIAKRTAFWAQGSRISLARPASKSSVGWPSEIRTRTGGSARSSIGGDCRTPATSSRASPMAVMPPASRSRHCSSCTGVGSARCHAAQSAKRTARTSTRASGLCSATSAMPGRDWRIAWFRACILPWAAIEPEQSQR